MFAQVGKFLTAVSPVKACLFSAAAHAAALGALHGLSLDTPELQSRVPGGDIVVELRLAMEEIKPLMQLVRKSAPEVQLSVTSPPIQAATRSTARPSSEVTPPEQKPDDDPEMHELDPTAHERARLFLGPEPTPAVTPSSERTRLRQPSNRTPPELTKPEPLPEEAATPSSASSAPQKPAETTGYGDAPPRFTYQPKPKYPRGAPARGWAGTVKIQLDITVDGTVRNVKVVRSSGFTILDSAAVKTISTWRCSPRTRNGSPVPSTETVSVHFELP
jgi:protein TonB